MVYTNKGLVLISFCMVNNADPNGLLLPFFVFLNHSLMILESVVSPETCQVETAVGVAFYLTTFCFPSALSSCLLASLPGCVSCWELCPKIEPDWAPASYNSRWLMLTRLQHFMGFQPCFQQRLEIAVRDAHSWGHSLVSCLTFSHSWSHIHVWAVTNDCQEPNGSKGLKY